MRWRSNIVKIVPFYVYGRNFLNPYDVMFIFLFKTMNTISLFEHIHKKKKIIKLVSVFIRQLIISFEKSNIGCHRKRFCVLKWNQYTLSHNTSIYSHTPTRQTKFKARVSSLFALFRPQPQCLVQEKKKARYKQLATSRSEFSKQSKYLHIQFAVLPTVPVFRFQVH